MPIALRDLMRSRVIAGVPMSFATLIILCPSRCTSCDSTSQQPMCPLTVTTGLYLASSARHCSVSVAAERARAPALQLVQKRWPIVRAMFR